MHVIVGAPLFFNKIHWRVSCGLDT